ncbi:MAG: tetratricopeptide repeat protein [Acidiferrobacteraceae bacterium]
MADTDTQALLERAEALLEAGRLTDARALYTEICQQDGGHAEAWLMLGALQGELGAAGEALRCFEQAITLRPDYAEAHLSSAAVLQAQGKLEEAYEGCRRAVAADAGYVEAWAMLGGLCTALGKREEAETAFRKARDLRPNEVLWYAHLGVTQLQNGRYPGAVATLQRAVQLKPDLAEAHSNLGLALFNMGRTTDAVRSCREAVRLQPGLANAHSNLGLALCQLGDFAGAVTSAEQAIRLQPQMDAAHNNLGIALQGLGRINEALAQFERAVQINHENADAHWNLALVLLLTGDFDRGWPEYEWRWRRAVTPPRPFPQPLWDGARLEHGTILLHTEQGFGDTLQFIRYATLVKERVSRVIVECDPVLGPVIATCKAVDAVVAQGSRLPPFDTHAPLLSFPMIFHTTLDTVPAAVPYLTKPEGAYDTIERAIDAHRNQRNIGIVWAGRPTHPNDRHRSCPVSWFAPLADVPGVSVFSLQKGQRSADLRADPRGSRITDLGPLINTFSDTAAAVSRLDLVITVDTAVAHLAGAMGKPVWVLLPTPPDWRWMLDRDDSPWYPGMRLFRQPKIGDWESVFQRVLQALGGLSTERH